MRWSVVADVFSAAASTYEQEEMPEADAGDFEDVEDEPPFHFSPSMKRCERRQTLTNMINAMRFGCSTGSRSHKVSLVRK
ncbi:hypothetical protein STCU_10554 [Strigomonas culicis]|uniref:Uncharacterized protein n=1 Tax=Strigomonas culicis TaxID=28005 RepID=S9TL53_9TRYP|nr:hypothetical protein STCU_10554 [Strigomonas culicis]|eukprot:EPY17534.1 hypothetical protein STCU_10554 [Strigomonas culicis]